MRSRRLQSLAPISVFDVFTPTTQARVNFVARSAINGQLVDALRTPGKQIVLYGESGSGKSTLLQKKLEELYEDHIVTRCSTRSDSTSILLDAFDQLNQYYVDSAKSAASASARASLEQDIAGFKATIERQHASTFESTAKRSISPQLTAQRLATGLGTEKMCWVIEDFHKVPEIEKGALSQAFKIFSDTAYEYAEVKIIAIGAAATPREVVEFVPEMRHRTVEVHVPLMTDAELNAIIRNGEKLMNVKFKDPVGIIPTFSSGLASVCHHLCLNMCLAEQVYVTAPEVERLGEAAFRSAVGQYIRESSDGVKADFDRALVRHRVRHYDNCRLILSTLANAPLQGMSRAEILEEIRLVHPDYPQGNLTRYLRQLAAENRGALIRHSLGGQYRFSDPIFHAYARAIFWPGRSLIVDSPELKPIYSTIFDNVTANVSRWAGAHIRRT